MASTSSPSASSLEHRQETSGQDLTYQVVYLNYPKYSREHSTHALNANNNHYHSLTRVNNSLQVLPRTPSPITTCTSHRARNNKFWAPAHLAGI